VDKYTDILRFLREIFELLSVYPDETVVLTFVLFAAWSVLRFVLSNIANVSLQYLVSEKVLKRLDGSQAARDDELRDLCRENRELHRELGRREGLEQGLREQLESAEARSSRAEQRVERLEAELRRVRWWRRL